MKKLLIPAIIFSFLMVSNTMIAQTDSQKPLGPVYDISHDPVLYTVGYAHLDTEWRWDYVETISKFLKATLDDNFMRFEKYKPYVFTFSGARRYRMMKEYYPDRYEKLKKYISQGRWFLGGSSVDECDANVPSPESIIRQVLYGNGYFRSEYGRESVDFMLPDCFGFQAHLPSALAHAGVKGFSTQKLSWGSAIGIPFNIGNWTGPDGNGLVAALNATSYNGHIEPRLDTAKIWVDRVMNNGRQYGVYADFRYYGVGDEGGAPREADIKNAIGSLPQSGSKINVLLSSSDQLFRDLKEEQKKGLPSYSGDLLLTEHSSGSLTSQSYMKRWNRKNEQLAMAAEPLAVMADWIGALNYPRRTLNEAWWLVLGSQMHDILPGTCIPSAYEYAWNDEVLGLNQFSSVLESSAGGLIRAMDTRGSGKTIVVYNPLAIPRKDLVEAEILYPEGPPDYVRVIDADNKEIPVQVIYSTKGSMKIIFLASVPSFGLTCYDVQPSKNPVTYPTSLYSTKNTLENEFCKVTINENGDISSIIDKKLGKEILSAPSRLEFLSEHPANWPAWNMDWNDRKNPPIDFVKGPAKISLIEKGPVRVGFKIERNARNSTFSQYISLAAGIEPVVSHIFTQWQSQGVSLKASFPLVAANPNATYNLGLGTIERGNNSEKKYEVPSREWFDLTDKSGNFGVTILEDSKFGSDKPNDKTIRLTLLYTPKTNAFHDQATQDWGFHEFTYSIYSHKGDWRTAQSEWQARRLNQPLRPFQVPAHPGILGKSFSFAQLSSPQVDVRAMKKAENGKGIVIRLQELWGKDIANVDVGFSSKIQSAFEVDGQERPIGEITVKNGKLSLEMKKYAIRSIVVQLESPLEKQLAASSVEIPIAYDMDVVSSDKNRKNGRFNSQGKSIPAELFPETLVMDGISFKLGGKADGQNNALICKGQKLLLPKTGNYSKLYILASADSDTNGIFRLGNLKYTLRIQSYSGKIGQFDNRIFDKNGRIKSLERGFIKRDEVAWFSTHLHNDTSNLPYQYAYLYKYSLDAGLSSGYIQLPDNDAIKIFAITVSDNPYDQALPAVPLYDEFSGRPVMALNLPKNNIQESMIPEAKITYFSERNLNELPARVTMKDYADIHQPNGVTFRFHFSQADTSFKIFKDGMNLAAVNDGMYQLLPNDSLNDRWSDKGECRIWMDLQQELELDSIHMFASLDTKRGPIFFSLWGATGEKTPLVNGDPKAAGWRFVAGSLNEEVWGAAKAVYSIKPVKDKPHQYRYLMWVSEGSGFGPYVVREIDVFEKQK